MEFCKVALTFESVDEILWCDYANETSQSVLSHGATLVFNILQNEVWDFLSNFAFGHIWQ